MEENSVSAKVFARVTLLEPSVSAISIYTFILVVNSGHLDVELYCPNIERWTDVGRRAGLQQR